MTDHRFGGDWTADKLERVRKYLKAYMTIFSGNERARKLTPIYVDAFAGTGYRTPASDPPPDNPLFPELEEPETKAFLKGSARIALEVEPPFKRYLFIERDPERAKELEKLVNEFRGRVQFKERNIEVVEAEANEYLIQWCRQNNWQSSRAVVFLDPYGMQVSWDLIEALGQTRAVDLWLLFPLGMAVNRLLTRNQPPTGPWANALTRMFGTNEWEKAFYAHHTQMTLFGEEEEYYTKEADFNMIGRFFIERLKTAFYRVAENPLALRNSCNNPLYLLCFASGNPKGSETAIKIAQHILST